MPGTQCLRGRRLKGKGKGVLGARETRGAREEGGKVLCLHYRVVSLGHRRNLISVRTGHYLSPGRRVEDFRGDHLIFGATKEGIS